MTEGNLVAIDTTARRMWDMQKSWQTTMQLLMRDFHNEERNEVMHEFLVRYEELGSLVLAARAVGVASTTINKWRDMFPLFEDAVKETMLLNRAKEDERIRQLTLDANPKIAIQALRLRKQFPEEGQPEQAPAVVPMKFVLAPAEATPPTIIEVQARPAVATPDDA